MIHSRCKVRFIGTSPLLFGGPLQSDKEKNEQADAYEDRCWMERSHQTDAGRLFIQSIALKQMLDGIAKFLKTKVKGKQNQTFMPYFASGIFIADDMTLDQSTEDIVRLKKFVPSDGRSGSGKRVWRNFPMLSAWEGSATFHILHPAITEEIFRDHIEQAGIFIGLGMWRPERKGVYGRFRIEDFQWLAQKEDVQSKLGNAVADRRARTG